MKVYQRSKLRFSTVFLLAGLLLGFGCGKNEQEKVGPKTTANIVRITAPEKVAGFGAVIAGLSLDGDGFAVELFKPGTPQVGQTDQGQSKAISMRPSDTVDAHDLAVNSLAITPDGDTLVSGSRLGDNLKLWLLPSNRLLTKLKGHAHPVLALAITPDGRAFASSSADKTIKLWSLPLRRLRAILKGHGDSVNTLAITPDGKTLASGSKDSTIKLWALPEGRLLTTLKGHKDSVVALAITPDGKTLVSGSADTTIKLWSLPDNQLLSTLEENQKGVAALAITPDGKILASGSYDGSIMLWKLLEKKLGTKLEGHAKGVNALAITPDGKMLASGGNDCTVRLWSLPDGQLLSSGRHYPSTGTKTLELEPLESSTRSGKMTTVVTATVSVNNTVESLAITPNGKLLASGDTMGRIFFWDLSTVTSRKQF